MVRVKLKSSRRGGVFRSNGFTLLLLLAGLITLQQLLYLSISPTPRENPEPSMMSTLSPTVSKSVNEETTSRAKLAPAKLPPTAAVAPIPPARVRKTMGARDKFRGITTVFSTVREDRSGAAITNYLMGHAFAFSRGMEYGGVCGNATQQLQELIDFLGLVDEIPFGACPSAPTHHIFPEFNYKEFNGSSIFTEEWRRTIRNRITIAFPSLAKQGRSDVLEVAVHVRRGDVTRSQWWRYLPDRHYLEILDKHVFAPKSSAATTKKPHVTIFSESKCRCFKSYTDRNYTLNLDGNLTDVWGAMMQSDVLILSRSDFSFVPALLGKAKRILYTPYDKEALSGWETIDPNITARTNKDLNYKK